MTPAAAAGGSAVDLEGLAAAARVLREDLLALAAAVLDRCDPSVIEPPEPRTVMNHFAADRGQQCLGEVVVTTARVAESGRSSWSIVLGWDEEGALAAAIVGLGDPSLVRELGTRALRIEDEQRQETAQMVAATRMEVA